NYARSNCHVPTHTDYNQRHNESQEYQRINTKLNGKISDSELDITLLKLNF
ncbi:9894_t:CDS:2, partial [Entrophospora sp. SA101]